MRAKTTAPSGQSAGSFRRLTTRRPRGAIRACLGLLFLGSRDTYCHEKGKLTQNFSCASIKLIPKKGDATKIKNWRPISLLSCLYKVISRALNNRLKKATGYIYSRAQKGFTSDRHIQEVLLNVTEMISHCKSNN
ncbi:MAG: reverse transcriptase domain-containing protein, partial [bacterium]